MTSPTSPPHSIRLSPLEGFMPRAYVRQIYCFPASNADAVSTLSRGLSGLARDVPYILSRIVPETSGLGPGITVSTPCLSAKDIFSWHDLSNSIDYASLKAGHFPPGAFSDPGIIPPDSIPPYPGPPAVFLARASVVEGGFILCVAVHHAVTDITGFGALLKIWAAHCRDGSSRDIGFDASWMDRAPLFSAPASSCSPSNSMSMPDLLHVATPGELARSAARSQAGKQKKYQTAIFYFPQHQLRALKDAVNKHVRSTESESWVSTSDILSSLLWSSIVEAQERSYPPGSNRSVTDEDTRNSILSFPVQFRFILRPPLPRDFLGAAFLMTIAKVLHRDICLLSRPQIEIDIEAPVGAVDIPALARVALAIRRSTQKIDDAAVREVLAYLEAHPEINPEAPLILGPPRFYADSSGTSVVSWADQGIYELDWGGAVGRCDAVRLPKMGYERDPIVLPRVPSISSDDGGLEVIMSYEGSFMRTLIECPVMRRFAVLRCLS
ncbi:hypothetical protein F5Y10DRAFT_28077 [Nemania abortiva]|nr:hypothetical protein F5Y10DRAFT_28077 [Nemania abortiva]